MAIGQSGETTIIAPQDIAAPVGVQDQTATTAKLHDAVYGDQSKRNTTGDNNGSPSTVGRQLEATVQKSASGDGHSLLKDMIISFHDPEKPESLSTGDTLVHEKNRDIIVMPKDEGSLTINRDGSFDLQLNPNSKETTEVAQKNGVTTVTFKQSGDRISFDQDGPLSINRGTEGISWMRFNTGDPMRGDRSPALPPNIEPAHQEPRPGDGPGNVNPGTRAGDGPGKVQPVNPGAPTDDDVSAWLKKLLKDKPQ